MEVLYSMKYLSYTSKMLLRYCNWFLLNSVREPKFITTRVCLKLLFIFGYMFVSLVLLVCLNISDR